VIYNASILRIDAPADADGGGNAVFITGSAVCIRCTVDNPTFNQRAEINQQAMDATTMIYAPLGDVKSLADGSRLSVQRDDQSSPLVYLVRRLGPNVKSGGLSHAMMFARQA
jgi:hypothetical protein